MSNHLRLCFDSNYSHPKEPRDPRFVSVVGEYSSEKFQRHYEFLVGAHMAELFTLKENLKTARKLLATSPRDFRDARSREVEHLELAVKRAESQVNKDKTKKIEQEALKKVKREEREKRLQGKSAWYMKKGMTTLCWRCFVIEDIGVML